MERTISASELKNNLGAILRVVRNDEENIIVEQRGVPAAAIVSIEDLRLLREAKEKQRQEELLERLRRLDERLAERQKDMSPEEADRIVKELSDTVMEGVIAKNRERFEQFR